MPSSQPVQSVLRALDILELVALDVAGVTLDEIASRAGLNKSTAHNLVRTLRMRGYLEKGSGRRFFMGGAVQELWFRRERLDIFQRAEQEVRCLHDTYPEATINFCELVGSEISCRLRMAADCPGVLRRPRSQMVHPYNSAAGLCFQACNVNFRDRMEAAQPFDESSQLAWKSAGDFLRARAVAARDGLAEIQVGDRLRLAAPVTDVFTIGLQYPLGATADREVLRQAVKGAAQRIETGHAAVGTKPEGAIRRPQQGSLEVGVM